MSAGSFRIERSTNISRTPQEVFRIIANIHRFNEWSPWAKLDPNSKIDLSGAPGKVGSGMKWSGNKKVGSGDMTVVAISEPQSVEVDLNFLAPFKSSSKVTWAIEASGGGQSKVSWIMTGEYQNLIHKLFSVFMRKMLHKDFDNGLSNLKNIAEK